MKNYARHILLMALAAVSISCDGGKAVSPENQEPEVPPIKTVSITASSAIAVVGSTVTLTPVVSAEGGVKYKVEWSLGEATTAASIDAQTGVLTALAPGLVSIKACATATAPSGAPQTLCADAAIRIIASLTPANAHGLLFVRNGSIYLSRPNSSDAQELIPNAMRPAWSPDGTRIAFTNSSSSSWNVCVADYDGSDIRCTTGSYSASLPEKPSWSPDGMHIAFSTISYGCTPSNCGQGRPNISSVMILDVLTMRTDSLHTPSASSVSWSADGHSIAFAAAAVGTHGTGALGIVQPDGSGMQIVAPDLGVYSVTNLAWSPDGNSLAVALINENACPWYCDTALGVVNRDGTGLRIVDRAHTCFLDSQCVTSESYIVGDPEWTDDGARIAYTVLPGRCYDSGLIGECGDIMTAGVNDGSVSVLVKIAGLPSWRR